MTSAEALMTAVGDRGVIHTESLSKIYAGTDFTVGLLPNARWMSEQLVCFDNWRPSSPDKARTIACQFRANEPAAFCIVLRIGSASGRFPAHEIFDSQGKTGAAGKD